MSAIIQGESTQSFCVDALRMCQTNVVRIKAVGAALCALVCVFVGLCAVPAYAATPDDVREWFATQGCSAVVSRSAQALPDMNANAVAHINVDTPVNVMAIRNAPHTSVAHIAESDWWIASLTGADGALVGVLWADFSQKDVQAQHVTSDRDLAQKVRDLGKGTVDVRSLVYDPALEAWFFVEKQLVTPLGSASANLLAGAVPVEDFLVQRDRIAGVNSGRVTVTAQRAHEESRVQNSRITPVGIVVVLLVIIALATVSLLWLRWESRHADERDIHRDDSEPTVQTRSFSIIEGDRDRALPRLGKSAWNVHVYRRDAKEDEE